MLMRKGKEGNEEVSFYRVSHFPYESLASKSALPSPPHSMAQLLPAPGPPPQLARHSAPGPAVRQRPRGRTEPPVPDIEFDLDAMCEPPRSSAFHSRLSQSPPQSLPQAQSPRRMLPSLLMQPPQSPTSGHPSPFSSSASSGEGAGVVAVAALRPAVPALLAAICSAHTSDADAEGLLALLLQLCAAGRELRHAVAKHALAPMLQLLRWENSSASSAAAPHPRVRAERRQLVRAVRPARRRIGLRRSVSTLRRGVEWGRRKRNCDVCFEESV